MTKAELIDKISEKKPGLTRKQVEVVVNTVLDSIKFALAKEDKVEIRGFGSFRIRHRRAKEGRNPDRYDSMSKVRKGCPSRLELLHVLRCSNSRIRAGTLQLPDQVPAVLLHARVISQRSSDDRR